VCCAVPGAIADASDETGREPAAGTQLLEDRQLGRVVAAKGPVLRSLGRGGVQRCTRRRWPLAGWGVQQPRPWRDGWLAADNRRRWRWGHHLEHGQRQR